MTHFLGNYEFLRGAKPRSGTHGEVTGSNPVASTKIKVSYTVSYIAPQYVSKTNAIINSDYDRGTWECGVAVAQWTV